SGGNGVYGAQGSFPTQTSSASNYWVDVSFSQTVADTFPPASTTTFPAADGAYNAASWAAGCPTPGLCGTATDALSSVQKVELSIKQESTGNYWNGASFSS